MNNARHLSLLALTALLLTTGAGCLGGAKTTNGSGGVYASADNGATWQGAMAVPTAAGIGTLSEVDVLSIERDPADAMSVYLGTLANGLFTSLDGGASWSRPKEPLLRQGAVIDVAVDPRDVCTYYVLTPDRLIKTTSCGRKFDTESYKETATGERLSAVALDWANPDTVWLGDTDGAIIRSGDAGKTWAVAQRIKDDVTTISVSNANSNQVTVGTLRSGIIRTSDGGVTWKGLTDEWKQFKGSDAVKQIVQSKDGKTVLALTNYGLVISDDQGVTWRGVALVPAAGSAGITAVGLSPSSPQVIYYGSGSALAVSKNGGQTWAFNDLPSTRVPSAILVDPTNPLGLLMGVRTPKK